MQSVTRDIIGVELKMAKGTRVRDQDKFMLRLPDGMRERIKMKAERAGMSMNEAIVWCLDQYFPAPTSFDEKVSELKELVALLADEANGYRPVDDLVDEIHKTLTEIAEKKMEAPPNFRGEIQERLFRFERERLQDQAAEHGNPFDDDEPMRWGSIFDREKD